MNTIWYLVILVTAFAVLTQRQILWSSVFRKNKALFAIYLYFLLSAMWSESTVDSVKRITKDFEAVLVSLVLLSEKDVGGAIRTVFVRTSYVLFPLSIVFIKFFPSIGRNATRVGDNMFTGITTQKNSLGLMVFVLSLVIIWDLIQILRAEYRPGTHLQALIRLMMLGMGLWLLKTCDSQTSLLSLSVGGLSIWACSRLKGMRSGRRILLSVLIGVALIASLDKYLGFSKALLEALGRDPTLTGRTDIWKAVITQPIDPILGNGFWVFWYSDKGAAVIEELLLINSAHNGYLEIYLDGGLIALLLLVVLLVSMGRRAISRLFDGDSLGVLAVTFCLVAIPYNFSESSFFRMDLLWFSLLLLTTEAAFLSKANANSYYPTIDVVSGYEYRRS